MPRDQLVTGAEPIVRARRRARPQGDRGAAVAEFVMVSVLLIFMLFGVLQVAALLYVRSVVSAAASDGARYGADSGVDPSAGGPRASDLITEALSPGLARRIPCVGSAITDPATGVDTAKVTCRGDIRSIFLPVGALVSIDVSGQSLRERP
ncbi:TadE family protein [Jatrophihabitans sp. DSM 45814]